MKAPNARIKNSNVGTPNVFEANPPRPPPPPTLLGRPLPRAKLLLKVKGLRFRVLQGLYLKGQGT